MDELPWRELTPFERELTQRLLDGPLPAKDEQRNELRKKLREQVAGVRARTIAEWHDNYGSIEFELPKEWPRPHYPIVEGMAGDQDGVPIDAILFEASSRLYMLELVKMDGSPIIRMPDPTRFRVWVSNEPITAAPPWPEGALREKDNGWSLANPD